jgi:hypothetical protein
MVAIRKPKPSIKTRTYAKYIAMVVRNEMENFHSKQLSNAQMKQLNPLIRNAICTALYASETYDKFAGAKAFVDFNFKLIPRYWEEPKLTDGFLECLDYHARGADD